MAPFPLKWFLKRYSATQMSKGAHIPGQLWRTIDGLLDEREPFKRKGYPRAGGFDRLSILAIKEEGNGNLLVRHWLPAPRMVYVRNYSVHGKLDMLVPAGVADRFNALVMTTIRTAPGKMKYGEKNLHFARAEQGIFLQALHCELCRCSVPNHLQGAIQWKNIPLLLPWDFEEALGLVV
jgi:hypothetical protein